MQIIDAHAHLPADHPDVQSLLAELGVHVLNISLGLDPQGDWRGQPMSGELPYVELARSKPERFGWCTAFDAPSSEDIARPERYRERILAQLQRDFANGAVACKVWKNIGIEVKDADGRFLMVDSPLLEPVFELIEREERVLIMHTGEPLACWQPLDPSSPHHDYYRDHPQWHLYGRPEFPSHAELMSARDRVLERHPKLRVVGAHLGSLEYDVGELEQRFRRFPNFSVDTAERLQDLARQPVARVRAFFEAFSDRVLYGSDLLFETAFSAMSEDERRRALEQVRTVLQDEPAYYGQTGEVLVRGKRLQGLGLSEPVFERVMRKNAQACYGFG